VGLKFGIAVRGGRGLKLLVYSVHGSDRPIAPILRGGRGLKHLSNLRDLPDEMHSAHPSGWARIERGLVIPTGNESLRDHIVHHGWHGDQFTHFIGLPIP